MWKRTIFVLIAGCVAVLLPTFLTVAVAEESAGFSIYDQLLTVQQNGDINAPQLASANDGSGGNHPGNELDEPIVVLALCSDDYPSDMEEILQGYDDFDHLDYINASTTTPLLEDIQDYDVVWVYSNNSFDDPVAMGDLLADFMDAGGCLVLTQGAFFDLSHLEGRLVDEDYMPLSLGTWYFGPQSLGNFNTEHPIMEGVTWGINCGLCGDCDVTEGSEWVASYAVGVPLVAVRERIVSVNDCFLQDGLWNEGDMFLIFHNSLIWAAGTNDALTITATPWNIPTEVGPNGGSFRWDVGIENVSDNTVTYDAWTEVILPNGNEYGPLDLYEGLVLDGGETLFASPLQSVPGFAPCGIYTYFARVGEYPEVWVEDSFDFEKLPPEGAGVEMGMANRAEWTLTGWLDEDSPEFESALLLPGDFELHEAYPNPFNPNTEINFTLPERAQVTLTVYDITGREVARLVNGSFSPGQHAVKWNAVNMASGIYFIQATVTGKRSEMRKVVLMK